MPFTTPAPPVDVLTLLPELADQRQTCIRLHPRPGVVEERTASKIGGNFLWPADIPWPTVPSKRSHLADWFEGEHWKWDFPDGTPIALVPVLQLNQKDVPEFPFPEGKDLFQLLWYPLEVDENPYSCTPQFFWHNTHEVTNALSSVPLSPYAFPDYVPKPCQLTFERVNEYPDSFGLTEEQRLKLELWDDPQVQGLIAKDDLDSPLTLYDWYLSSCRGNKLLGYTSWIQYPEYPSCKFCHQTMTHLLTLTDMDVDGGTWHRWLPIEDRPINEPLTSEYAYIINPMDVYLGGGSMYYFICLKCGNHSFDVVFQR